MALISIRGCSLALYLNIGRSPLRRIARESSFTVAFLVYQAGTLITTGTLGAAFVPGLVAVLAMVGVIVYLIRRNNK